MHRWMSRFLLLLTAPVALTGCISGPPVPNPYLIPGNYSSENPLFVPQGQDAQQYQRVYDIVYDVAHRYFDIAESNMYAGEILGVPRVSAGVFDWITYGGYDAYELFQSTAQSIRRRLQIQIIPAEVGGYFVLVKVVKELEDPGQNLPSVPNARRLRPDDPTNPRGVTPSFNPGQHWIDLGRDTHLEELILSKLKQQL